MAIPISGPTLTPKRQTDFSPSRDLTEPEIRQIISQRRGGQTVINIAGGMNLATNLVLKVIKGEAYQVMSAPIFAKMVFPGPD